MIGYFNRYRENILRDQPRQRYLGLGVSILWVLLLIAVGLIPAIKGATSAQRKANDAKGTQIVLEQNVENITKAKQLIQDHAADVPLVDAALPNDRRAVTFMNEVDLAVAVNNLSVEGLDYDGETASKDPARKPTPQPGKAVAPKGPEKALGFNLRLKGDYAGVRGFIERLESMPRLVSIASINIKHEEGPNGTLSTTGQLSLLVSGEFYYLPEVTPAK